MRGVGLVHLSEKTESGGLRIERCAIVEANALTEFEGVGETVWTDRPGSRQAGFRDGGAMLEAHETLADVDEYFHGFAVVHVGGVELLGISSTGKRQGGWFGLAGALTACECEAERV